MRKFSQKRTLLNSARTRKRTQPSAGGAKRDSGLRAMRKRKGHQERGCHETERANRPTRAAFQTALLQLQNAEGETDEDPEDDKRRLQIEFMHGTRLHTPMALCKPFTKFANLTNDTVVETFSQLLSALRGVIEGKFPEHKLVQGVLLHSKKGCAEQKFHRDYPYSACSLRRASPSYGVIFFPDGGTLEVVPGSHKAEIESPKRTVRVPPNKLLVFHEGLAHAGSHARTATSAPLLAANAAAHQQRR